MASIGEIAADAAEEAVRRLRSEVKLLQEAAPPVKMIRLDELLHTHAAFSSLTVIDASDGNMTVRLPEGRTGEAGRSLQVVRSDDSRRAAFVLPEPGQTIDGADKVLLPMGRAAAMFFYIGGDQWVSIGGTCFEGASFENGDGGRCTRLINNSGAVSIYGDVAEPGGVSNSWDVLPADDPDPIGAVWEPDVADGSYTSIVTHGRMQVRLEDTTGTTVQWWVRASSAVAGRVETAAAPPAGGVVALDQHTHEVGHALETVAAPASGNSLVWIMGHQL